MNLSFYKLWNQLTMQKDSECARFLEMPTLAGHDRRKPQESSVQSCIGFQNRWIWRQHQRTGMKYPKVPKKDATIYKRNVKIQTCEGTV